MKKTILNQSYWDNRYINHQTGWDLGEISPAIKKWFDNQTNKVEKTNLKKRESVRYLNLLDT